MFKFLFSLIRSNPSNADVALPNAEVLVEQGELADRVEAVTLSRTEPMRVQKPRQRRLKDPRFATPDSRVLGDTPNGISRETKPKYLRYNLWDLDPNSRPLSTADWTESALPLPRPPREELSNSTAATTIASHPNLFRVETPINVDQFEARLRKHPNQPFVSSVCAGLREGFWPWASTLGEGYPDTYDASSKHPVPETRATFLREQALHEIDLGRYSEPFGTDLLPGMYCMPSYAIPKPNSNKMRLINDHSATQFSLNSMIPRELVSGSILDDMFHVGHLLLRLHKKHPRKKKIIWKSDVSEAFRILPFHPFWQIKQATRVNGELHIDRRVPFGNRASAAIFVSFNSLVTWIAQKTCGINIITYVDDSAGCDLEGEMGFYAPYNRAFPKSQTALLMLWDELGIPHKEDKQLYGTTLPVLGIRVNPTKLLFSLVEKMKKSLIDTLSAWCRRPSGPKTLKRWQELAGTLNYAFNVLPRLRPCLNNFYPEIKGLTNARQVIRITDAVRDDLLWARHKLATLPGVFCLDSLLWTESDATHTIYCDACLSGMAFWYPKDRIGFNAPAPPESPKGLITYFEVLCVLSAVQNVVKSAPRKRKILIYIDSTDTVAIFNSLRCLPFLNPLLREVVDRLDEGMHDLRVVYVPGEENGVADALARRDFRRARGLCPSLRISSFKPYVRKAKGGKASSNPV